MLNKKEQSKADENQILNSFFYIENTAGCYYSEAEIVSQIKYFDISHADSVIVGRTMPEVDTIHGFIPTHKTIKALKESRNHSELKGYTNIDDLFADLEK